VDPVEEAAEDLALDQPGGPDRNRWKQFEQFAGGPGLELKEPFEVLAS